MISDIKVHSAKHLTDAYSWLSENGNIGKILAGGTDLMVYLNAKTFAAPVYLDIWGIDELRGIKDEGNSIFIGSLTTYTQIIKSEIINTHAPILVEASRTVGAVQIQNRGTIGGNIVNASPAGDTLPVFSAFNADLEIGSSSGRRTVAFDEFYTGYRQTVLAPDELLLGVRLHKDRLGTLQRYRKIGTRRAQAISKVVIAVNSRIEGQTVKSIRIGLGSVAPTVIRAIKAEEFLNGHILNEDSLNNAANLLKEEISPIDDIRSTAHYRKTVSGNIFRRLLLSRLAGGK